MRARLLAALLFVLPAVTYAAERPTPKGCAQKPHYVEHEYVCTTHEGLVRRISRWNHEPIREDRQLKLTIGFSTDLIGVTTPAGTLAASAGEGDFLSAFASGVRGWLAQKQGAHTFTARINPGSSATSRILTDNPSAFSEGEQFAYWGSRDQGFESKESPWVVSTLEIRPRLGGEKSRWRIGTQVAFSSSIRVETTSEQERIGVSDVQVAPFSPRAVQVTGSLSRSYHREKFTTSISAWQLTMGPEFELLHEGTLDLSVEAGYAFFNYSRSSKSELYQSSYLLFAPEIFVPDLDPAKLLEGGETPLTEHRKARHNRHQFYLGARAEVYPFQRSLGLGLGVRWYPLGLPLTHTFTPSQFGGFDQSARNRHWVATASITLGFNFSSQE